MVRCINHQKVSVFFEPIEIGIVDGASLTVGYYGILTHTHIQCGGVIGKAVLQEIKGAFTVYD